VKVEFTVYTIELIEEQTQINKMMFYIKLCLDLGTNYNYLRSKLVQHMKEDMFLVECTFAC
jgi:hypothetical protein